MIKILLAFLSSFFVSLILMPLIIRFFKKKKAEQTILSYVEVHKDKNGTLTMGGVVFILTTLILVFFFLDFNLDWLMVVLSSCFFGLLGLMDDYLKIKYHQNLGLRPYQKIVGQVGISLIFAIFIYKFVSTEVFIPFTLLTFDAKIFVIPLIMLVLIATTNSVNLTDGIDGLAGKTCFVYFIFFAAYMLMLKNRLFQAGETGQILTNLDNMITLSAVFSGSILGFLIFNTSKASIFMGDVGSLCLGGFVGTAACMVNLELIVPFLGFCFVFSAVSVILQVLFFKATKKRIFKMAPFHHHLQMSGLSEPKIVIIYESATIVFGILCLILLFV